ncbi:uncharacterized protein TNCV_4205341 [Trichonephila clavipes]|nr:uncharacterized protein TNCV_4205341 [Trichonephila clavipes]
MECRSSDIKIYPPIRKNFKRDGNFGISKAATRGLLATDHVILNHGQVTWTTPELAPPLLTTTQHQWEDVSALDRFNVHRCPYTHQDSRIRVWRLGGKRILKACVSHRPTGLSPGVMVWGVIGYASRSLLVRMDGTLNSSHYISDVLRSMPLPFIRAL